MKNSHSKTLYKIEGLILKTLDFQDYDKIIQVFTENQGILSLIVKGANRPKQKKINQVLPLIQAEFIYKEGRSDVKSCVELSVLNYRLQLRDSLPLMEASFDMINAILKTQLQGMQAPALYQLLKSYLDKLSSMQDPITLSTSFRLKTLRHEGQLDSTLTCATCKSSIELATLFQGETFCEKHAPEMGFGIRFDREETLILQILNHCRSFHQISNIQLGATFKNKIKEI